MTYAAIDIAFIALAGIFAVRGAVKGFIGELFSMAGVVLGLLAALLFFRRAGLLVRGRFMPDVLVIPEIIAFAALFAGVFLAVKMVEIVLKGIVEGVMLGGADRFLGLLFGLAEGVVVVCLALFLLTVQPLFDSAGLLENSVFARWLLPFISGQWRNAAPPADGFVLRQGAAAGVRGYV